MFYTYSISQFGLALFYVLNSHMWLMATVLDSATVEWLEQCQAHGMCYTRVIDYFTFQIFFKSITSLLD